jgi:hypothetical protein
MMAAFRKMKDFKNVVQITNTQGILRKWRIRAVSMKC